MSGVDLHPNKRDATTGTALTTPSEAVYDARWAKVAARQAPCPVPVAQVPSVTQRDTTNNVEGMIRTNVASGSGVILTQNGALASDKRGQAPRLENSYVMRLIP